MDITPNYQNYTLEELYYVAQHINREKYPERYILVEQEIRKRKYELADHSSVSEDIKKQSEDDSKDTHIRGCAGLLLGASAGIGVALLWLFLFPPADINPNTDGLNRWGGHMGAAMMGAFFGGVLGTSVGAGKHAFKIIVSGVLLLLIIKILTWL